MTNTSSYVSVVCTFQPGRALTPLTPSPGPPPPATNRTLFFVSPRPLQLEQACTPGSVLCSEFFAMALRPDDPRWRSGTHDEEATGASAPGPAAGGAVSGGDDHRSAHNWWSGFLQRARPGGSEGPRAPAVDPEQGLAQSRPLPGRAESVNFYMRSAEITAVSRLGRRRSFINLKSARGGRGGGVGGGVAPAELRRRIAASSKAAADPAFDVAVHRDLALAGVGVVVTFHFLALATPVGPGLPGSLRESPAWKTTPRISAEAPSGVDDSALAPSSFSSSLVLGHPPPPQPVPALPAPALAAVQSSWSLVKGGMDAAVGQSAFVKLLAPDPEKLKLFGFRADPNFVTRCACGQRFIGLRLPSHVCMTLSLRHVLCKTKRGISQQHVAL